MDADIASVNFHWCSVPEPAECSCVCKRHGCLQLWRCREGKGMLLSRAAFPSSQDPVHVLHWVELGGSHRPLHSSPLGNHPMSVACNCCEQWMAEGSWYCCYRRKRLFTYPKAALSFLRSFPQSGGMHHNLCQKIHWVWFCGFWGLGFFWGVFWCFLFFSPWTANSYSVNIFCLLLYSGHSDNKHQTRYCRM